ncbi:MAG: SDR family NAD(P)-dependent oxidoreductase [Pseudomonadota bacterium]
MSKTILITGATDGIGLETARNLVAQGYYVLLHGRSADKLQKVETELSATGNVETYLADLSDLAAVKSLAQEIKEKHSSLDVLINNAGVLKSPNTVTVDGLDIRFAVNTVAPYLLTQELLPVLGPDSRVINLSSAAQGSVDLDALRGKRTGLDDMDAYAQSKLAITMWSIQMAEEVKDNGPVVIPVNPGSLLASKMVKEGFGVAGHDLSVGADILTALATEAEFADKSGHYFDNDKGKFSHPHSDALNDEIRKNVVDTVKTLASLS